jgi:hypothetical protein
MVRHENRKQALSTAVQHTIDYCPDDVAELTYFSQYNGESKHGVALNEDGVTWSYEADVWGGDAKFFEPMGIDEDFTTSLTNGENPHNDTIFLYVSQINRPLYLEYSGAVEIEKDVFTAEFSAPEKLLYTSDEGGEWDAAAKKTGTDFQGLQSVADIAGLPFYLSQVNFLNSDATLLDSSVNNANIYHCAKYHGEATGEDGVSYDDPSSQCELIDPAWITANEDMIKTFILVEPASGATLEGHKRLMVSTSPVKDCNPAVDMTCLLAISGTQFEGSTCHTETVAPLLTLLGQDPAVIQAAVGGYYTLENLNDPNVDLKVYNPGFPCSEANVLTPKYKGGKASPVYWIDQWNSIMEGGGAGLFADVAVSLSLVKNQLPGALIGVGVLFILIGVGCIVMCKKSSDKVGAVE